MNFQNWNIWIWCLSAMSVPSQNYQEISLTKAKKSNSTEQMQRVCFIWFKISSVELDKKISSSKFYIYNCLSVTGVVSKRSARKLGQSLVPNQGVLVLITGIIHGRAVLNVSLTTLFKTWKSPRWKCHTSIPIFSIHMSFSNVKIGYMTKFCRYPRS